MDSLQYETALLLEDEPFITVDVEDMLSDLGFRQVTCFDTCADALSWLASNKPEIAVIDLQLKDGQCDEVDRRLHQLGVPTIVHSAFAEAASDAFRHSRFVPKPAQPKDFSDAISSLVMPPV
jgi:two-component system, response regulator PdtaR